MEPFKVLKWAELAGLGWPQNEDEIIKKKPQRLKYSSNQKMVIVNIDQWPILHLMSTAKSEKFGSP